VSAAKRPLRQLPPSAVPLSAAALQAGLFAGRDTYDAFRAALAGYLGVAAQGIFLAASGRTALYTLLKGLQTRHPARTQVVMPAYTCPSVPKVVLDLGLTPVYVDIVPQSMHYEGSGVATAVSRQTLAICLIHPFGIPQPVDDVLSLAHAVGAVVIEDAAQALGSRRNGASVGLVADFGLFSLGPGKPLSTAGGGILITSHKQHIQALHEEWADLPSASNLVSVQAWLRQAAFQLAFHPRSWWAATRLGLQRLGNHEASWGYTLRDLSNAQAGIGLALLPHLDEINAQRKKTALRLAALIEQTQTIDNIQIAEDTEPIFLRLPVLAQDAAAREKLYQTLWSAGIGVGRMYERPLPAIFPQSDANFPGAESFAERLLTLPTHYHVSEDDISLVGRILRDF
jgi:dTDP-4-amino-4,6-dideoxygalactose transaminase